MLKIKRWRYRRAMWRAIKKIRHDHIAGKMHSVTDALRVIRRFQVVNGVKFDPFNRWHVDTVKGKAFHENYFRTVKSCLSNLKRKSNEIWSK